MPSTTNVAAALFGGFALYKLVGYWIFKFTMQRFTVVNELSTLGKSREDGEKLKRTAVICGGRYAFSHSRLQAIVAHLIQKYCWTACGTSLCGSL